MAPSTQKDGNGVKVIYTVVENPVIQGINIHGNTLFSTPDILKVLKQNRRSIEYQQSKSRQRYHPELISRSRLYSFRNFRYGVE